MTAYITIGDIKNYTRKQYKNKKECTRFLQAVYSLVHVEKMDFKTALPISKLKNGLYEDDEFSELIYGLPVDVSPIINKKEMFNKFIQSPSRPYIREDNIIPPDRNIFSFIHIPYVNDGIHTHDHFEINYVYKGICRQDFGTESRVMAQGELCIIAPNSPHNVRVEQDDITISILVRKSTFDQVFWHLLTSNHSLSNFFRNALYGEESPNYLNISTYGDKGIRYIIQRLVLDSNYFDIYSNNTIHSYFTLMLTSALRLDEQNLQYYNQYLLSDNNFEITLILKYIQQNYKTITLKKLANKFNYAEATLSKYFNKKLGKSFTAVLQEIRMQRASELIVHTNLSIEKISEISGYNSVDHFSRTFKKAYNMAPTKYRKEKSG